MKQKIIWNGDVIVVGGGPAGMASAISSARHGAKTLLIERYNCLGGMGTSGLVYPFMFQHAKERVVKGIFDEIVKRLKNSGGYREEHGYGKFDIEIYKSVLEEMCIKNKVELLYQTLVVDVLVKNNKILGVMVENKTGRQMMLGKIIIDATGDADIAYKAGVPYKEGREKDGLTQPMTLMFRVGGVKREEVEKYRMKNPLDHYFQKLMNEAMKNKDLMPIAVDEILFFYYLHKGEVIVNTTRIPGLKGTNAWDLTKATIEGRKQVMSLIKFFRKYLPGFENCYLISTGPTIGVRETRRIEGEYTITEKDILSCRKFPDVIACGFYGVDIHKPEDGTTMKPIGLDKSYDIPYRALIPKKIKNLLVAGRCISSTHEAHSAIRIQPQCMAIGQAAGTAAALSLKAKTIPRKLDIKKLQIALIKDGVYLGK